MAPERNSQFRQLPLIPKAVLKRHKVFETFDTRFRSCARLLQALWRESQTRASDCADAGNSHPPKPLPASTPSLETGKATAPPKTEATTESPR